MGDFRHHLILGGARSGKTRHALDLAESLHKDQKLSPVYVATAQNLDAEMADRITRHQQERGDIWQTQECAFDLSELIIAQARPDRVLLVDCLTIWLSNIMLAHEDADDQLKAADQAREDLIVALGQAKGTVIFVANEVGFGIVPENALARRFRDQAGWLNQAVARTVSDVVLVAAGLPLSMKKS